MRPQTPTDIRVRTAAAAQTGHHHGAWAALLARVFAADPHFDWMVRGDARREDALRGLFRVLLGHVARDHGRVDFTADEAGLALWYPPGSGGLSVGRRLGFARRYLGLAGWRRAPSRLWGLQRAEGARPRGPHYYLQVIGVDPAHQGCGYGAALLRRLLERCAAEGVPAYLETAAERNLAYYGGFGFRVSREGRLPGGPTLWSLLWSPAPRAGTGEGP